MELAINNNLIKNKIAHKTIESVSQNSDLTQAGINLPYIIRGVNTTDQNMREFLFSLGCYEGETVTVISVLAENYVIHIKDARYSIDENLASVILI